MKILEDIKILDSEIGNYSWIRADTQVSNSNIGRDVFIGFRCRINNAVIADNVEIASNCIIGGEGAEPVALQRGCWLGADAVVKPGVRIGEGAVIGADTIVENDVEQYSIVVGKPGKTIRKRSCVMDGLPEFRKMFNNYSPLNKDESGNLISADWKKGNNLKVGQNNILIGKMSMGGGIFCGDNVTLGNGNILEGAGSIYIGSNTKIGNNVHMISNSHDYTKQSFPMIFQPIKIGSGVTIGDGSIILGNIKISDNKTIPSNSLVLKNK